MADLNSSTIITPGKAGNKTVVVIGAFRGGTSMIAAAVDAFGIPMRQSAPVESDKPYDDFEDKEFQDILHDKGSLCGEILASGSYDASGPSPQRMEELKDKLNDLIKSRNTLGNWGWKYPFTTLWILKGGLLDQLENAHVVTVFRDPVAIWQRECSKEVGALVLGDFQKQRRSFSYSTVQVEMLARCAKEITRPQMVVSYERASKNIDTKRQLAIDLQQFLSIQADEAAIERAVQAMFPRRIAT